MPRFKANGEEASVTAYTRGSSDCFKIKTPRPVIVDWRYKGKQSGHLGDMIIHMKMCWYNVILPVLGGHSLDVLE